MSEIVVQIWGLKVNMHKSRKANDRDDANTRAR